MTVLHSYIALRTQGHSRGSSRALRRVLDTAVVATLALAGTAAATNTDAEDIAKIDACLSSAAAWKEAEMCIGTIDGPCQAAGSYSTQEMVECVAREGRAWKSILDAQLARLHANAKETDNSWSSGGTGPELDAAMSEAQEAWIAFLESQCHYLRQLNFGGSIVRLNASSCYMRMTAERAIELNRLDHRQN